jgi:hypothetical protein
MIGNIQPITPANQLRGWLKICGLSQRAGARELEISERQMRQWCAGNGLPPRYVFLSLAQLANNKERLGFGLAYIKREGAPYCPACHSDRVSNAWHCLDCGWSEKRIQTQTNPDRLPDDPDADNDEVAPPPQFDEQVLVEEGDDDE